MVCIFMFHAQHIFLGIWLSQLWQRAREAAALFSTEPCLPPLRAVVLSGGWGQRALLLIGEGFSRDPEGLDGQDRAVPAGAYQPAWLSCRERRLCVLIWDALCDHSHCQNIPVDKELQPQAPEGLPHHHRPLFWWEPPPQAAFLTVQHCHIWWGMEVGTAHISRNSHCSLL